MGISAEEDSKNLIKGHGLTKKSRKKNVIGSIVFILIFLFLLRTVSYIVRTNGAVKDRFSGFYAEPKDTIDAVMIGSSPVYPYYSAPQMYGESGIAAYPLSSNLQRPAAALGLMEEAYKRQSPKLFIFEMRMYLADDSTLTENMSYTRGVTDNLKYSYNRIKTVDRMVKGVTNESDQEPLDSYYFDIMKFHSNWAMLFIPYEWRNWNYTAYDRYKGYEFKDTVGPCSYNDVSKTSGMEKIPEEQEQYLDELISYLKAHDQEALFIVSPYIETEEDKKKYNYMEKKIGAAGYDLIDLNDHVSEIGLDYSKDIADYGTHVNAVGAEKCTSYLETVIDENYDMPDRRNDKRYARWDKAYEEWKTEMGIERQTISSRIKDKDYFVREDN